MMTLTTRTWWFVGRFPAGSRPGRPRPASRWSTARPGNASTWSPRNTWPRTRRRGRGCSWCRRPQRV